jgi:hypothetical protein
VPGAGDQPASNVGDKPPRLRSLINDRTTILDDIVYAPETF